MQRRFKHPLRQTHAPSCVRAGNARSASADGKRCPLRAGVSRSSCWEEQAESTCPVQAPAFSCEEEAARLARLSLGAGSSSVALDSAEAPYTRVGATGPLEGQAEPCSPAHGRHSRATGCKRKEKISTRDHREAGHPTEYTQMTGKARSRTSSTRADEIPPFDGVGK